MGIVSDGEAPSVDAAGMQAAMLMELSRSQRRGGGIVTTFGWLAVVAVALAFAWPVGLAAHAVWWLFTAGWNVIG